jgi:putative autotransporter adhesin-like protein
MEHRRSIFGPLLLIAAGSIWLLVKSGNISSANLWALTHVWPFLLIAVGVGIILRPYWKFTGILLDILIIGGFVFAIIYAPRFGWATPAMGFVSWDGNDAYFGPGDPGSGVVKTETRKVSDFHALEIDYPAQVVITQGTAISVKIEAEDNVLPGLKTEVKDGTLNIFYKSNNDKHVNPTKAVKITIVVKDLDDVQFSSAGELTIKGLKTDQLDFSLNGAGKVVINDIETKILKLDLSGAGSLDATGTADDLDLNISGFGSFEGADLHSQTASITISGAGSATTWVDDELDANVSGAGSINYYGSASVTKNVGGVGSVNHQGDK